MTNTWGRTVPGMLPCRVTDIFYICRSSCGAATLLAAHTLLDRCLSDKVQGNCYIQRYVTRPPHSHCMHKKHRKASTACMIQPLKGQRYTASLCTYLPRRPARVLQAAPRVPAMTQTWPLWKLSPCAGRRLWGQVCPAHTPQLHSVSARQHSELWVI